MNNFIKYKIKNKQPDKMYIHDYCSKDELKGDIDEILTDEYGNVSQDTLDNNWPKLKYNMKKCKDTLCEYGNWDVEYIETYKSMYIRGCMEDVLTPNIRCFVFEFNKK